MELYNYTKISKSAFRAITSVYSEYIVKYEKKVELKEDSCSHCPIFASYKKLLSDREFFMTDPLMYKDEISSINSRIEEIRTNCANSCEKAIIKKEYNNDDNKYKLYGKKYRGKRVPKACVKTFLLLHLIPNAGEKGHYIIKNLNSAHIADKLSCTVKTAEKSLRILEALGYVLLSNSIDRHHFNIIITSMSEQYLSAEHGGSGYITLSKEIILDLVKQSNINSLRFDLIKLLKVDDHTRRKEESKTVEWKLKDVKWRLPAHIRSAYKIRHLIANDSKLFNQHIENDKIVFNTKSIHLKDDADNYVERRIPDIQLLVEQYSLQAFISSFDIKDIATICLQYSLYHIENALKIFRTNIDNNTYINSIGAFIRKICYNCTSEALA